LENGSVKKLREYIKVAEAAEVLGVSQTTLRKWADNGHIAVRINSANGYRLFQREELTSFLKRTAKTSRPVRKPR
jgi:excisionase family DNA binding protein